MKKTAIFTLLIVISSLAFAQRDYDFSSTGQQKLLINPSFCASAGGFELQTLAAAVEPPFNDNATFFSNYTGLCYGGKRISGGISNTYYTHNYYGRYLTNQTDATIACSFKAAYKITIIPSVQGSFYNNYKNYMGAHYGKKNGSLASGLLIDVNKILTFGAAFYDINQPDLGLGHTYHEKVSQYYHVSFLTFKNEKINLQPYAVLKKQASNKYIEAGAHISHKFFSLHLAIREIANGSPVLLHADNEWFLISGVNFTLMKIKFGYTIYTDGGDPSNEIFLSYNFSRLASVPRRLMIN